MPEINKNGLHFLSYYVANHYSPKEDRAEEVDRTDQIKYFSASYEIHHRADRGRGTKQNHSTTLNLLRIYLKTTTPLIGQGKERESTRERIFRYV